MIFFKYILTKNYKLTRLSFLEWNRYFSRMHLYMFYTVVKFQTCSCDTFWGMNFFLVLIFGQVTSRQKAMHMRPLCISTGGLKYTIHIFGAPQKCEQWYSYPQPFPKLLIHSPTWHSLSGYSIYIHQQDSPIHLPWWVKQLWLQYFQWGVPHSQATTTDYNPGSSLLPLL